MILYIDLHINTRDGSRVSFLILSPPLTPTPCPQTHIDILWLVVDSHTMWVIPHHEVFQGSDRQRDEAASMVLVSNLALVDQTLALQRHMFTL